MSENILLQSNEEIRLIIGYEGLYSITSFGRAYSHERKVKCGDNISKVIKARFLKSQLNKSTGYLQVYLCREGRVKFHKVHRLVAQHYIPNLLNLPMINHKDTNKQNCKKDNLEWCTKQENENHAAINKLYTFKKHSEFYGVTFDIRLKQRKKPWRAMTRWKGKQRHIGTFYTEVEAAQAYNNFVVLHGLNRPLNKL